jgi:hypothetical protein
MRVSSTSISERCARWGGKIWCMAFQFCHRSSRVVRCPLLAGIAEHRSHNKHSSGRQSRWSSCMEISAGLSHRRLQAVIAIFFGWWMTLADICGLCCCPPKTVRRQPSRMSRRRRNESVARSFVPYVPIAGVNSQRATSTTTLPSWVCSGSSLHPSHLLRTSCMLKAKDLLDMFWGEAVMTAIYVLSRSSSKGADGRT